MSDDNEELFRVALAEIEALHNSRAGVRLELTPLAAFQLVAGLQVALRHPHVPVAVAAALRDVAGKVEAKFQPYPATAEIIKRGWHKQFDEF